MIDAYIINLEKDKYRKELLIENINKYNVDNYININFIKAINQSSFSEFNFKICNTWYDNYLKTGITVGEVGCSLSHYKCWNEFSKSNKEHAIFFEDDIEFTNDFYGKLQILLDYPTDADIVYIHRKSLNSNKETIYNNNFINIKASYWCCGYLLTKKGVEKLLNTDFLNNLIIVDEFLPILYDNEYLSIYKHYYNNISLNAYSINNSFIKLTDGTFKQSSTFHSNYYKYDNNFVVITSDINTSLSAMSRFIESCNKYSLNYKIINDASKILEDIDKDKIIIISDSNYSFFINNPLSIFINNKESCYYNFNNLNDFIEGYKNNSIYFYGRPSMLKSILNNFNNFVKTNIIKTLLNEDSNISCGNFIIVNGNNNKLLLNDYENYNLRQIYSSYGFKTFNVLNDFSFKIRINILVYSFNYKLCIKNIKKIDYPSHLLDIHIYTNKKITIEDDIQIHYSDICNAYKDVYNYYSEYDYIWIINSDYIITDFALLKNCININKNISSGLQKSKNKFLSNFWGSLSETGWYKRSNDYFDIINLNKINIWNVPYVTGNILIKKCVLESYNIFKTINYNINNNIDMVLCENLRLNNEGIYLLNDKIYGYISEDLPDLQYWSEESILHPDFYDFIYNNKTDIFNEIGPDIWNIPFFSIDFCNYLIKISEEKNKWSSGDVGNNIFDTRLNAIENIPTQDIHLKDLDLHNFWNHIVNKYFKKIMAHLYKYLVKDYNISFIVKYDYEKGQKALQPHHDSSVYTINIALNSSNEYTGGGVNFLSRKCVIHNKNAGYLLLHPGKVTHYHEALPITSGKRYILVSFNH